MSRLPRIRCIDHVTCLVRSEVKDGDSQTVSVCVILNHHTTSASDVIFSENCSMYFAVKL